VFHHVEIIDRTWIPRRALGLKLKGKSPTGEPRTRRFNLVEEYIKLKRIGKEKYLEEKET
jgi:hypothetical protein